MRPVLLALLVALASLAGCLASPPPAAGASEGGRGGHDLHVLVTDEPEGAPIVGATVAISHAHERWDWFCLDGCLGSYKPIVTLTTDAEGYVHAKVPSGGAVEIRASHAGHTHETLRELWLGGSSTEVAVPLYRARIDLELHASFEGAQASLHRVGQGAFHWDAEPLGFGSTAEAAEGYARRAAFVNLTLQWTNGPTGTGDLGLAVGPTKEHPLFVGDASNDLTPGARSDELRLTWHELVEVNWGSPPAAFYGAGTGSAYVGASIPYVVLVEAIFDGDLALREAPFGGSFGAAAGLLLAALLLRRR